MRLTSKAAWILTTTIVLLSGCEQRQGERRADRENGKAILFGLAAPLTGDSSEFGSQIQMGVELGREQINEAGGINGRNLKIQREDDAGNPAEAQNVATELANESDLLAVIGHFNSSCSLAAKDIYTQAKIVMFSPGSTNVRVTLDSDYVFRNIFTDAFQGQSLADYAGKILGLKQAAILFDNDDYGSGLKDSFKQRAAELGMQIVSETAYTAETNDFRSQLETIRASNPEIILIAGLYKHAAVIAKQARERGIETQLIAGDGVFSQQFIDLAGKAAEGTFVTCPFLFDLGGERAMKFAEAFRQKFKREPDAWSALSYDALMLLAEAAEENPTREGIHQYLKGIDSPENAYDGLTGKTYFDENGDTRKPIQVAIVRDGKFVAAEQQFSLEGEAVPAEEVAKTEDPETAPVPPEPAPEDTYSTPAASTATPAEPASDDVLTTGVPTGAVTTTTAVTDESTTR